MSAHDNPLLAHHWGVSPAADRVLAEICGRAPSTKPWERLFMVLQAYMDESTDETGTFVLAGYIASAQQWARFSQEWEHLLPTASLNDRDEYRFKMSEMALSPERMSRVAAFRDIIQRHAIMSLSLVVNSNDIQRAIDRIIVEDPLHLRIDWENYANTLQFAFFALLSHFHNYRAEDPSLIPLEGPVDFYFDDHTLKNRILAAWDDFARSIHVDREHLYGATPRFGNDERFLPLQAADFLAWWIRRWSVDLGVENIRHGEYPFPITPRTIYHFSMYMTEDNIVNWLISIVEIHLPNIKVKDIKPKERVDPPFPAERAMLFMATWLKRILRR